jgi:uncharacterized protein YerC
MCTSDNKISQYLKKQIVATFVQTLCDFQTPEETNEFVNDFFTEKELDLFSRRLAVAYWLKKGRGNKNIKDNLKVTSSTISEVASLAKSRGFKLAIKKMEAEEWANVWSERIKKFSKKI